MTASDTPVHSGRAPARICHHGRRFGSARIIRASGSDGAAPDEASRAGGSGLALTGASGELGQHGDPSPNFIDNFTVDVRVRPSMPPGPQQKAATTTGRGGPRHVPAPSQGDRPIGKGHAGTGVSVGSDDINIVAHDTCWMPLTIKRRNPLTTWTRVAAVPRNGGPELFITGKAAEPGPRSRRRVHLCLWAPAVGFLDSVFAANIAQVRL